MSIKYMPGKVYLRDRRNGNVYEYEANLAANSNIEPFTPSTQEVKQSAKADTAKADTASVDAEPVKVAEKAAAPVPPKPATKK